MRLSSLYLVALLPKLTDTIAVKLTDNHGAPGSVSERILNYFDACRKEDWFS